MIDDDVAATARALEEAARQAGFWISGDGRVLEADAANLIGLAPGTLANMRSAGVAPPHFRIGRVSYRISDLAKWIEATRGA